MMKNKTKLNKGFTLIETLVSLAILTTAVVAMIWVAGNGVSDALYSKNKIISNYLAQEGIEVVRNIRDGEASGGAGWDGFMDSTSACLPPYGCTIDATPIPATVIIEECVPAVGEICNNPLFLTPASYYTHEPIGVKTSFRRRIVISPINDSEATVTVTVAWQQGGKEKKIVVGNYLSAWFSE